MVILCYNGENKRGGSRMRNISKAISGAGLLISGSLFINLVIAGMDWKRIGEYGCFMNWV